MIGLHLYIAQRLVFWVESRHKVLTQEDIIKALIAQTVPVAVACILHQCHHTRHGYPGMGRIRENYVLLFDLFNLFI